MTLMDRLAGISLNEQGRNIMSKLKDALDPDQLNSFSGKDQSKSQPNLAALDPSADVAKGGQRIDEALAKNNVDNVPKGPGTVV